MATQASPPRERKTTVQKPALIADVRLRPLSDRNSHQGTITPENLTAKEQAILVEKRIKRPWEQERFTHPIKLEHDATQEELTRVQNKITSVQNQKVQDEIMARELQQKEELQAHKLGMTLSTLKESDSSSEKLLTPAQIARQKIEDKRKEKLKNQQQLDAELAHRESLKWGADENYKRLAPAIDPKVPEETEFQTRHRTMKEETATKKYLIKLQEADQREEQQRIDEWERYKQENVPGYKSKTT